MNIFLTGTTGFLGNNITRLFIKHGHNVFGIVRKDSNKSRIKDIVSNKNFNGVNLLGIENVFKENQIDVVIHASVSYGRNKETPQEITETNVYFPLKILGYAMKYGSKSFINSDTFLMIGDQEQKDRDYIVSKKEFIRQAREKISSSFVFVNMKIEQMYGPDDNPTKFIPFLIKEFLSNKERIPLNLGLQKRDYVYVDDVATAYLKCTDSLEKLNTFEEFGVGTGSTHTLQDLVKEIKKATGSASMPGFGDIPYHPKEVMESVANIENNKKIDWHTKIDLEQGIAKTVEFYRKTTI